MTSERTNLRRFIINYHKDKQSIIINDELEIDNDEFFNIDNVTDMNMNDALQEFTGISDTAGVHSLLERVFEVGTDKEKYIFLCYLKGMETNQIAEIIKFPPRSVRYYFDKLLDKIII